MRFFFGQFAQLRAPAAAAANSILVAIKLLSDQKQPKNMKTSKNNQNNEIKQEQPKQPETIQNNQKHLKTIEIAETKLGGKRHNAKQSKNLQSQQ